MQISPIQARHAHQAGGPVEARSPTAAGQHASATMNSDVRGFNLIYRIAPVQFLFRWLGNGPTTGTAMFSPSSQRPKLITMQAQLAVPREIDEDGL